MAPRGERTGKVAYNLSAASPGIEGNRHQHLEAARFPNHHRVPTPPRCSSSVLAIGEITQPDKGDANASIEGIVSVLGKTRRTAPRLHCALRGCPGGAGPFHYDRNAPTRKGSE